MNIVHLLTLVAGLSIDVVGIVWLGTAVWFAAVRPGTLRDKLGHFARTLLPEPWMIAGLVVLSVVLHLLPRSIWDPITWKAAALTALGSVLIIVSAGLMVWARLALGTMWAGRPMIQRNHELRTDGPYRMVRHPIYTGLLGLMLGATLLSGFGAGVVLLAFVTAWLLRRVRVEDTMLIDTFGDDYRDYRHRVPALVPLARPRA
ncbi:isoprenylcysteine carboxylmethyltransferase family protein [Nocardia sp. NEAU-G5]|uniref:Isoprenylcysteine carboxylmethyltransferase family protein n=1 Tax=Nocardia albiluteola TaxID=2842303 RepID=A0ABS6B9T4_9NOCA|nr:isoprenylcysteine carboxylmethyltransferase family protein [Nocardia albiluteola]MBU3065939.1 isoprenylcysteine carboxylmethyltransferase family protein [Nocardia albiluteola]